MALIWRLVGLGIQFPLVDGVPHTITLTFGQGKARKVLVFQELQPLTAYFNIQDALMAADWITEGEVNRVMRELPFGPPPDDDSDIPF